MNVPITLSQRALMEGMSLDDKYTLERGRAFIIGTQALIRLPMLHRSKRIDAGVEPATVTRSAAIDRKRLQLFAPAYAYRKYSGGSGGLI